MSERILKTTHIPAAGRRTIFAAVIIMAFASPRPMAGEEATERLNMIRRVISERGEYDLAEHQLRMLIDEYHGKPAAAEALVLLGYCQDKQGKNREATIAYSRVISDYPNAPPQLKSDAGLGAADAYFRLAQYQEAIENYALVIDLAAKPEQVEAALLWRGEAKYRTGLEALDEGRNPVSIMLAAAADFTSFLERFPESKLLPTAMAGVAFAWLDAGEYAKALYEFQRFIKDFPDDRRAEECRYFAGECLYRLNRFDEAKAAYDDLLARNPTSPFAADAKAGSAWTLYSLRRLSEAAAGFEEAARLAGDNSDKALSFLYDAGCVWREAGEIQKAAEPLLEVAKAANHELNSLAWFRLGTLWQEQARTARERSEAAGSIQEKDRYRDIQKKLGEDAVHYFRRSLATGRLGNEEIEARSLMGEVLLDAERFEEAAEVFEEIARRWPDADRAPWALYHQALSERSLALAGKDEKKSSDHLRRASEALRKSLEYPEAKTRLQATWALADYLAILGVIDEAREKYHWLASEGQEWAKAWRGPDGRGDAALENRANAYAADSLFRLGESYYFLPDYPRAAGFYQEIIAKHSGVPQAAMALLRLGEIAENSKDASVALARYDEALRLALQFGKGQVGSAIGYARLQLGTLQFREGQREKADDQRRKLLQEALRNLAAVIADPPAGLNLSRPYYFMAEAKYSLGLKQEAVADYESGLRFDVDNELADALWSGVAWAKRDLGDASGAMEACRKVIDGFPASSYRPDALTLMAALRRAGGDTDGALADLELFLAEYQDHPQTARGDLERAAILGETGKYAEAAAAFQRFLDKYPSHPDVPQALYQRSWALWNRLGPRIAEAREAEVRWRELTDGRETAKLPENERIEASRAEQRKNDLAAEVAKSEDEILAAFRDLIERHPDYPVVDAAWLRIGEILYDRGDYQQAMAAYQKSLSLAAAKNGDLADKAQYRLAWSIQRLAESAEHLSMTAPDQTGREAARKEMWDRRVAAIDAFEVIIGRYPRSDLVGDACFRAAELRRRSGQDNTDPARRTAWFQSAAQRYRQALEKGGQSAPYRVAAEYGEGMCYLLDDKSTQAREVFRRLLLNPDSPYVQEAYWGLGQANLNLGAYSDATSAFEQAVAIDRTTETAAKSRYGLGITAAMSRDNVKARLEFLAVDALYPNYPEWAAAALVRAARAAIAEGMKDRAIGDLERVLARYPDTPAAVEARDLQASVMLN